MHAVVLHLDKSVQYVMPSICRDREAENRFRPRPVYFRSGTIRVKGNRSVESDAKAPRESLLLNVKGILLEKRRKGRGSSVDGQLLQRWNRSRPSHQHRFVLSSCQARDSLPLSGLYRSCRR